MPKLLCLSTLYYRWPGNYLKCAIRVSQEADIHSHALTFFRATAPNKGSTHLKRTFDMEKSGCPIKFCLWNPDSGGRILTYSQLCLFQIGPVSVK